MRLKTFFVLLLAALWGVGSWWWYTCKIKSYCAESSPLSAMIGSGVATVTAKYNDIMAHYPDANKNAADSDSMAATEAENGEQMTEDTVQNDNAAVETADADSDTDNNQQAMSAADSPEAVDTTPADDATDAADTTAVETMQAENGNSETGDADATGASENTSAGAEDSPAAEAADSDNGQTETATPEEQNPSPQPAETDSDADADGVSDAIESKLGTNPDSLDSDGDGLHDLAEIGDNPEQPLDSDSDGTIDALDTDDDNDGDLTANEAADPDENGLPDDARDDNGNGTPDYLDPTTNRDTRDDDGDGLLNGEEKRIGTNPTLTDTDGDGLSDLYEAEGQRDTDGDNTIDALDPDDDDDGIMTVMESADPNGDGNPSDALDSNDNGKPDYLDVDNTPVRLPSESELKQQAEEAKKAAEEAAAKAAAAAEASAKSDEEPTPAADVNISKRRIYFSFRSAELKLEEDIERYIERVIKQLQDNPTVKIKLTGHTDSVGKGEDNRRLGQERAEQIRDLMVKRGAPAGQIEVDSAGESKPIDDNKTEAGRTKNRRVELEQIK